MTTQVTTDAAEFRARVFPFLRAEPVLHTVLLTTVDRLADAGRGQGPSADPPGESLFVSAHDGSGALTGATMHTPGRPIHLGALAPALAAEIAEVYADHLPNASEVSGTHPPSSPS